MEHFEERAIREAPHPPDIWLRYVDDTFTVLQESEVEHFTHHLNSMDENIKFIKFTPPKGRKPDNRRGGQEHKGGSYQESAESKRLQNLDV